MWVTCGHSVAFVIIAWNAFSRDHFGLDARKPVFGVCDQVMIKPVFSAATETSSNIEILHETSLAVMLSRQRMIQALMRLFGYCSHAIKSAYLTRGSF